MPFSLHLTTLRKASVWKSLRPGDVVVIHSEPGRCPDSLKQEETRLQRLLNATVVSSAFPFSTSQGYLIAEKI